MAHVPHLHVHYETDLRSAKAHQRYVASSDLAHLLRGRRGGPKTAPDWSLIFSDLFLRQGLAGRGHWRTSAADVQWAVDPDL